MLWNEMTIRNAETWPACKLRRACLKRTWRRSPHRFRELNRSLPSVRQRVPQASLCHITAAMRAARPRRDGSESIRQVMHGASADWLATGRLLRTPRYCIAACLHLTTLPTKPTKMLRAVRPATLVARQARLYSTQAEKNLASEFVTERAATAAHAKRAYQRKATRPATMSESPHTGSRSRRQS